MIDNSRIEIREANLEDVNFISEAIIEAEKSSTKNNGLAKTFKLSDDELKKYLVQILQEEEDGCELSLSSFLVACYDGEPVATLAGWTEGVNETQSAFLKANLLSYYIPRENIMFSREIKEIVADIQIPREEGKYQIEFDYTKPEFRGNGLKGLLLKAHLDKAKCKNSNVHTCQTHVFANNEKNIRANGKAGFKIVKRFTSNNPSILEYYPDSTLLLMELEF